MMRVKNHQTPPTILPDKDLRERNEEKASEGESEGGGGGGCGREEGYMVRERV